jgi:hypothetical protein
MSAADFIHNDSVAGEELLAETTVETTPTEVPPEPSPAEVVTPPAEGETPAPQEDHIQPNVPGSRKRQERLEKAEAKAAQLEAELEALRHPKTGLEGINTEDFESLDALVAQAKEMGAKEAETRIKSELAKQEAVKAQENWRKKDAEFAKDKPDFPEAVAELEDAYALQTEENSATWQAINMALSSSDASSAIKYHLGKNPQEIDRLIALTPIQAIKEMARIEDKLSTKPTFKPVSQAPAPPTPIPSGATSPAVRRRSDGYIHS